MAVLRFRADGWIWEWPEGGREAPRPIAVDEPAVSPGSRWVTRGDVTRITGLSRQWVDWSVKSGRVRFRRVTHEPVVACTDDLLIVLDDVEAWIEHGRMLPQTEIADPQRPIFGVFYDVQELARRVLEAGQRRGLRGRLKAKTIPRGRGRFYVARQKKKHSGKRRDGERP